jgi:hypothetical protein
MMKADFSASFTSRGSFSHPTHPITSGHSCGRSRALRLRFGCRWGNGGRSFTAYNCDQAVGDRGSGEHLDEFAT